MTQIRSHVVASRRPGELGIHSVDGFHLVVPDLKQAEQFYAAFGLDLKSRGNGLDMHTFGHPHRWGTVSEGKQKRLSHVSFGVFEDDVSAFKARLQTAG